MVQRTSTASETTEATMDLIPLVCMYNYSQLCVCDAIIHAFHPPPLLSLWHFACHLMPPFKPTILYLYHSFSAAGGNVVGFTTIRQGSQPADNEDCTSDSVFETIMVWHCDKQKVWNPSTGDANNFFSGSTLVGSDHCLVSVYPVYSNWTQDLHDNENSHSGMFCNEINDGLTRKSYE